VIEIGMYDLLLEEASNVFLKITYHWLLGRIKGTTLEKGIATARLEGVLFYNLPILENISDGSVPDAGYLKLISTSTFVN
jgi:hypothetical protein